MTPIEGMGPAELLALAALLGVAGLLLLYLTKG